MTITEERPTKPSARETGGSVFRQFRESAGISQVELAQHAGVSVSMLGRMERGAIPIYVDGGFCPFQGNRNGTGPRDEAQYVINALIDCASSKH